MRRRTIVLVGGVVIVLLGAGLYGLGLYFDADSVPGDPNIGSAMAVMFGGIVGVLGLGVLVAWAIAALVVSLRQRDSNRR